MIFRRKGMQPVRLSGLNTIQDVGPTLADMAGFPPAAGWIGAPVDSRLPRANMS